MIEQIFLLNIFCFSRLSIMSLEQIINIKGLVKQIMRSQEQRRPYLFQQIIVGFLLLFFSRPQNRRSILN